MYERRCSSALGPKDLLTKIPCVENLATSSSHTLIGDTHFACGAVFVWLNLVRCPVVMSVRHIAAVQPGTPSLVPVPRAGLRPWRRGPFPAR